jgi:hypothetical protein
MATKPVDYRRLLLLASPFVCIHTAVLLGTTWEALAVLPPETVFADRLQLLTSHLRELAFLGWVYGVLAWLALRSRNGKTLFRGALAASTLLLTILVTLSSLSSSP